MEMTVLHPTPNTGTTDKLARGKELLAMFATKSTKLLSKVGSNPKTAKSDRKQDQYLSTLLHLAPSDASGFINTCPWASPGCKAACLHTAGNPVYWNTKKRARNGRTQLFAVNRPAFLAMLKREISNFVKLCENRGKKPAIRLNGTSDIPYERICPELFTMFPSVQFYDYTKSIDRVLGMLPDNYDLTFSASETNDLDVYEAIKQGKRVAVVTFGYGLSAHPKPFPATNHRGITISDADADDLTFLRPAGLQALRPKGKAITDNSGFTKEDVAQYC